MHRRFYVLLVLLVLALGALGRSLTPGGLPSGPLLTFNAADGTPQVIVAVAAASAPDAPDAPSAADAAIAQSVADVMPSQEAIDDDMTAALAALPLNRALRANYQSDLAVLAAATVYSISLEIFPEQRRVVGHQRTRFTNRASVPLNDIAFKLYPNSAYLGGSMRVTSAQFNLRDASLALDSRDASTARLMLPSPLAPGKSALIDLAFEIGVPSDPRTTYATFGWTGGILSLPNAYALIPPLDTEGRWRLDALPQFGDVVVSDVAAYRLRIRAPAQLQIVASGDCVARVSGGFGETECIAAPARDVAIHASTSYQTRESSITSVDGGTIKLRVVFTRAEQAAAGRALIYAADALRRFEILFGAYPFSTLTVFQSTTPIGGIEYPMLAGVTPFRNDEPYFEWLVAHEIAHQWWYGIVGSDPLREAWLDEALTQYSTLIYARERLGARVGELRRTRFFNERWRREIEERGDAAAGQVTIQFQRRGYAPIVYGKAPLFFDQVETEVGTAAFLAWLRRYFEANRFRLAHSSDLLNAADQTGIGPQVRAAHARWITRVTPDP